MEWKMTTRKRKYYNKLLSDKCLKIIIILYLEIPYYYNIK